MREKYKYRQAENERQIMKDKQILRVRRENSRNERDKERLGRPLRLLRGWKHKED